MPTCIRIFIIRTNHSINVKIDYLPNELVSIFTKCVMCIFFLSFF